MEPDEVVRRFHAVRVTLRDAGAGLDNIRSLTQAKAPLTRERVTAWRDWSDRTLPDLDAMMDDLLAIAAQLMADDVDVDLRQEIGEAIEGLDRMRASLKAGRDVLAEALCGPLPGDRADQA